MTIGKRIKKCRKKTGDTQEELSRKIGTTVFQISRWETEKVEPRQGLYKKAVLKWLKENE